MIKLHHLRDFVAIAREKSIRGAARTLNLAQPALTRSLSELEARLGAPLVERNARGILLTPAGERFLIRANAALAELQHGIEEVAGLNGLGIGSVCIGMSTAVMFSIVPEAYNTFRKTYPDADVRFMEATFSSVETLLQEGQVDFYVGLRPSLQPGPAYKVNLLFHNKLNVYARIGHPLSHAQRLSELVNADWIVPGPQARTKEYLGFIFETHGLPMPKMNTRSDSMLGLLMLMLKTNGITLLPMQWDNAFGDKSLICSLPIQEELTAPDIVIITKAGSPLTPLAEAFAILLEKCARRYADSL